EPLRSADVHPTHLDADPGDIALGPPRGRLTISRCRSSCTLRSQLLAAARDPPGGGSMRETKLLRCWITSEARRAASHWHMDKSQACERFVGDRHEVT